MSRLILLAFIGLLVTSCKTEEIPPVVRKEVVIRNLDVIVKEGSEPYNLDIDSNGFTDYRLLVSDETTLSRSKAIFRIEGVINGILTTVIHGKLLELTEDQQCDVLYPSILQAQILNPLDEIGNHLDDDWWLIGDFHHFDLCYGGSCACPGQESDVEYLPLTAGSSGFVAIRFIRRERKHFGWIEIERLTSADPQYLIRRVAWRRTSGEPVIIDDI